MSRLFLSRDIETQRTRLGQRLRAPCRVGLCEYQKPLALAPATGPVRRRAHVRVRVEIMGLIVIRTD
jgi:hypothetical protein